jgi:hypothetical protein
VAHVDRLDGKRVEVDRVARLKLDQLDTVHLTVLAQLGRDETERHPGAVDRNRLLALHLHNQEWERADVILMAVGDDDGAQVVCCLTDVAEIGDHQVDTVQLRLGKLHASIDHQHLVVVLENRGVLSDLSNAA